ncbi:MAG TPA: hypothetical protein VG096_06550 [Bryobacteraceae bacterium]|nr:hypothetical protein [Bryobacteraceae bacterium]
MAVWAYRHTAAGDFGHQSNPQVTKQWPEPAAWRRLSHGPPLMSCVPGKGWAHAANIEPLFHVSREYHPRHWEALPSPAALGLSHSVIKLDSVGEQQPILLLAFAVAAYIGADATECPGLLDSTFPEP